MVRPLTTASTALQIVVTLLLMPACRFAKPVASFRIKSLNDEYQKQIRLQYPDSIITQDRTYGFVTFRKVAVPFREKAAGDAEPWYLGGQYERTIYYYPNGKRREIQIRKVIRTKGPPLQARLYRKTVEFDSAGHIMRSEASIYHKMHDARLQIPFYKRVWLDSTGKRKVDREVPENERRWPIRRD